MEMAEMQAWQTADNSLVVVPVIVGCVFVVLVVGEVTCCRSV